MIDEKLLNKFDRIHDLPISEEILGAYFEGNLSDSESIEVSSIIDTHPDLSFISFEIGTNATDFGTELNHIDEEFVPLDFGLPEINEVGSYFQFHQPANEIDIAAIREPQLSNDMFGLEDSDTEVISDIDNNNVQSHDSFDMDSQSLDSNSNSGINDDMLNENLDFQS